MGNQGITWIVEHIPKLFTTFIHKITKYQRNNTDSKIIDIAYSKTCIMRLLDVG